MSRANIQFGGEPWRAIPRSTLRDPRLSPKAKGGLVSLLSHEEGWVRSVIAMLQRENDCGRDQAQSIMRELVRCGYAELVSTQERPGGEVSTHYIVRAIPSGSEAETVRIPPTGKRTPRTTPRSDDPATVVEPLDVEPLDEEQPHELQAPAARLTKRDSLWEFLYLVETGSLYQPGSPLASNLRGRLNAARKQAGEAGLNERDLATAMTGWGTAMGDARITANGLVTNAPRCLAAANGTAFSVSRSQTQEAASRANVARLRAMRQAADDEEAEMKRRYEEVHGSG